MREEKNIEPIENKNFGDTVKAMLRGKFIALSEHIGKVSNQYSSSTN